MPDRPGVGLIGCGRIALQAHLPAYGRLRHQLELVAVAGALRLRNGNEC